VVFFLGRKRRKVGNREEKLREKDRVRDRGEIKISPTRKRREKGIFVANIGFCCAFVV